ncbi:GNAT family N-acetyltransferase [Burkholderiaceae bacterium DAT-1]|nr:GNAT family N-acetyltransferase [Burkholderiaceae bacterium DAT-1]
MHERIVRIDPEQWALLRSLRLQALQDAPYAFGKRYEEIAERRDEFWQTHTRHYAESNDSATFILCREGNPVGMIGALLEGGRADHAFVCAMWVSPNYRRGGAGQRLVDIATRWLADQGAERINAWIAEGNPRAIQFYERIGFVQTDQTRPLKGMPAVNERLLAFDCAML